jgi:AraC-like DNA-binding protein
MIYLKSITDLHNFFGLGASQHPLIAVLDFSKIKENTSENTKITTDFYSIMFKNYCKNTIKYGRKTIDFQEGNLICIAPNQAIELDTEAEDRPDKMGWGLFFHPDLIRATSLNEKMNAYSFFSYEVTEALHLSDKEKTILFECIQKITTELQENIDVHSQNIIVATIELVLNYCSRFYGRQMITRSQANQSVVTQIQTFLKNHFAENSKKELGLPTVKFLANHVNLSPSYLSDLLKKETGKNTQEHIHFYLVEAAKNFLLYSDKNINEISFHLGFEYPHYFNKLFKQKTGKTPMEYRKLN